MPTETLQTRTEAPARESFSRGFAFALTLHGLAFGGIIAAAWIGHNSHHWGDADPNVGSIQASMVNSLPLATKQRFDPNSVLSSEHTSVAPTPPPPTPTPTKATAPPKSDIAPKPNEIAIPNKTTPKPVNPADHPQPNASKQPAVAPPPPTKATTGDSSGMQLPQSITQLKNGTAAVTIEDRSFGDRFAYYIKIINQKIYQSKAEGDPDGAETKGKTVVIHFTIDRGRRPNRRYGAHQLRLRRT